jgi:hypothetical protein
MSHTYSTVYISFHSSAFLTYLFHSSAYLTSISLFFLPQTRIYSTVQHVFIPQLCLPHTSISQACIHQNYSTAAPTYFPSFFLPDISSTVLLPQTSIHRSSDYLPHTLYSTVLPSSNVYSTAAVNFYSTVISPHTVLHTSHTYSTVLPISNIYSTIMSMYTLNTYSIVVLSQTSLPYS